MSEVAALLAEWIGRQRWYATKALTPRIRIVGSLELDPEAGADARPVVLLALDDAPERSVLYQIPVVRRAIRRVDADAALIGEADGDYVYDGPSDPVFVRALLQAIRGERALTGVGATARGVELTSSRPMVESRVFEGEQSNTSIVCTLGEGPVPFVIAKVFRVLHHGENPDVTTLAALTRGSSHRAPPLVGFLTADWPDPVSPSTVTSGHIAFVQEFLPGTHDGWRLALQAAAADDDFTDRAYGLGVATAEVHATLASVLPTYPARHSDIEDALIAMRRRLGIAVDEVPGVARLAGQIETVYDAAASGDLPRLQRIHGDLHLGQALLSPDRGWMLIDFEGEPLRPMEERSRPDATLRDVAGMLRSFDYVAGSLANTQPGTDVREWASRARQAYLDGYVASSGLDVGAYRLLLDAFELDKAVYEAVYESRSRPTWVGIPLAAIERLVADAASSADPR